MTSCSGKSSIYVLKSYMNPKANIRKIINLKQNNANYYKCLL